MNLRIAFRVMASLAVAPALWGESFVNLNFESAAVAPTPRGGFGSTVDPALAFPGWSVGFGGQWFQNYTLYNNLTLGSVAQVLIGPAYPNAIGYMPLQGSYSALLQFGPSTTFGTPALSQTGLVPADARSITFLTSPTHDDARVTLNGIEIPLSRIGGGRLAGDVSPFAGMEAQLTFSTRGYEGNWLLFDDVRFSPIAVPEPSGLWLLGLGCLAWPLVRGRLLPGYSN